jgi:hypothetical protein
MAQLLLSFRKKLYTFLARELSDISKINKEEVALLVLSRELGRV